jgi:hypothetical protein
VGSPADVDVSIRAGGDFLTDGDAVSVVGQVGEGEEDELFETAE